MDFEQLVSGSEKLLSHIARPDGIPRLNKNLGEIERGSLRMGAEATTRSRREALSMGVTPEVAEQKQELKGGSMLARNRFDPEALDRMINAVQLRGGYQRLQPLGETDIEGYLAHHHDMIVLSAVEETRRASEECSLVRQREWEVESWRQAKKIAMDQVFDAGVTNGGSRTGTERRGSASVFANSAADSTRLPSANSKPDQSLAVYVAPPSSASIIPPITMTAATTPIASRLTALEADHAAVIRELNLEDDDRYPLATKLSESAEKAVVAGTNSGPQFAYHHAWEILRAMLEGEEWAQGEGDSPKARLDGTVAFLQAQFHKMLEAKVKKAREAGTLDVSSLKDTATGLQPKVRAYMRLEGIHEVADQSGPMYSGLQVWPQIYLCMRCGGMDEAAEIAQGASVARENQDLGGQELELLKVVAQVLTTGVSASVIANFVKPVFESMRDGDDMHKRTMLNIVARANSKSMTRINKETIEDYMWFKLSFVDDDVENSGVLRAAQERVSGRDGRRNFDPDGNNPFAYVNVLLYTQQLGAVVAYLHWKGQYLAALHMAIAMLHRGVDIYEDTPYVLAFEGGDNEPGRPPLMRDLVERSMQGRFDSDPEVCAEYIFQLTMPEASDCLADLAAHIGAPTASRLLGYLKTDATRHEGMLDRLLTSETVQEIAFAAGYKAEGQGKRADAITFYGLAFAWDKMMIPLVRELSARIRPNAENRSFWKEIATKIHDMLMNVFNGREVVEDEAAIMETLFQLLRLLDFYDILQKREFFRALLELERCGLLPSSLEEANHTAGRIKLRGTDGVIMALLPEALETGMQCLRHHHLEVKRELTGNPPGKVDVHQWRASREKRLADLENKGKAMMCLVGRLSDMLPTSFVAGLSRVESSIIK